MNLRKTFIQQPNYVKISLKSKKLILVILYVMKLQTQLIIK